MRQILFAWLPLLVGVLLLLWAGATLLGPNPRGDLGEHDFLEKMTQSKKRMVVLVVGVAVMMSLILMLMALLMSLKLWVPTWLVYILNGFIGAVGLYFVGAMMYLLGRLFTSIWARVAVCTYIPCAVLAWFFWPSWLTITLLAIVIVLAGFAVYLQMTLNFKAIALFGAGLFIYDIVNVYFTGNMLRVAVPAMEEELPAMVVVPQHLELEGIRGETVPLAAGLGLGDIIVPGMLIMIAAVLAYRHNAKSVLYGGLAGYAVGMIAVFAILYVTKHPQPALITLYPAVLAGILLATRRAGLTRELFALRHAPRAKPEIGNEPTTSPA